MRRKIILECRYIDLFVLVKPTFSLYFGSWDTLPNEGRISERVALMAMNIPAARPSNARFSSGPCTKIPTFSLDKLADAPLGRSHRAAVGKAKLRKQSKKHERF